MTQIIDLSRIQETSDGDLEFEQELIQMYLEDAAGHVEQITKQIAMPSIGLRNIAHTLKGSSANIGATAMRNAALAVEKYAGGEGVSDLSRLVAELEQALVLTKDAYLAYMVGLGLTPP
jgi:HPt (histidine-containing phosphotransfer) domain-containing protein